MLPRRCVSCQRYAADKHFDCTATRQRETIDILSHDIYPLLNPTALLSWHTSATVWPSRIPRGTAAADSSSTTSTEKRKSGDAITVVAAASDGQVWEFPPMMYVIVRHDTKLATSTRNADMIGCRPVGKRLNPTTGCRIEVGYSSPSGVVQLRIRGSVTPRYLAGWIAGSFF